MTLYGDGAYFRFPYRFSGQGVVQDVSAEAKWRQKHRQAERGRSITDRKSSSANLQHITVQKIKPEAELQHV